MKLFRPTLFLIFVLASCHHHKQEPHALSSIDFTLPAAKSINLSEICSTIEYIKLETGSKCYINHISKIKFFGDSIFIFNELGWNMGEILVFNKSGKFLLEFGQLGEGPEEIENPRDIIRYGDSYLIWDRLKVSEFDHSGRFIKKLFSAFLHGNEFFSDSGNIYLYHGTEFPGMLTKYNKAGILTDTLRPANPAHHNTSFEGENVQYANNEFHLFAPALDTVWALNSPRIIPKYILDFKGEMTLEKFFKKVPFTNPPDMLAALNSTQTSNVLTFLENDSFLFLKYIRSRNSYFKLINKKSNRQTDFVNCKNDIDFGLFGIPIALTDDQLVIPLEPVKILRYLKDNGASAETKNIQAFNSIKESDNPILMLCKLK